MSKIADVWLVAPPVSLLLRYSSVLDSPASSKYLKEGFFIRTCSL